MSRELRAQVNELNSGRALLALTNGFPLGGSLLASSHARARAHSVSELVHLTSSRPFSDNNLRLSLLMSLAGESQYSFFLGHDDDADVAQLLERNFPRLAARRVSMETRRGNFPASGGDLFAQHLIAGAVCRALSRVSHTIHASKPEV